MVYKRMGSLICCYREGSGNDGTSRTRVTLPLDTDGPVSPWPATSAEDSIPEE